MDILIGLVTVIVSLCLHRYTKKDFSLAGTIAYITAMAGGGFGSAWTVVSIVKLMGG